MNAFATQPKAQRSTPTPLDVLRALTRSWEHNAQVRRHRDSDIAPFVHQRLDLPESLLPFAEHPLFHRLSAEERAILCAAGAILFHAKTVEIERSVLIPACHELMMQRIPGTEHTTMMHAATHAMTDESFHIRITHRAQTTIAKERRLTWLSIPRCAPVAAFEHWQATTSDAFLRRQQLVGVAIATEVLISGMLRGLASAKNIQPISVDTARIHLTDELSHASVFKSVARHLYQAMTARERNAFVATLREGASIFATGEADAWSCILRQLGTPNAEALVRDCIPERDAIQEDKLQALIHSLTRGEQ